MIDRLRQTAELHQVIIDGAQLTCRSWGHGRPLVLLHGSAGNWGHWVRNIDHLSGSRRVIVPDLPGFGDSNTFAGTSLSQLVDALAGMVNAVVGDDQMDLAGMSFGGIVAGHLAARCTGQVDRVVLVSVGGIGMTARVTPSPDPDPRAQLARFMFADPTTADDTALAIHIDGIGRATFRTGGLPASTALVDVLPAITAEIDAVYSTLDAFFDGDPTEPIGLLQRVRPDVRGHVIPDSGHWIPYEKADQLNALMSEVLTP